MLVSLKNIEGDEASTKLLHEIFKIIPALNPSKDATAYWLAVNKTMLGFSGKIENLWKIEKLAAIESIAAAKEEAITYLSNERTKIMQMSHEEALKELVRVHKIENRIEVIKSVSDNGILGFR
jgi:type II restriction enzyme